MIACQTCGKKLNIHTAFCNPDSLDQEYLCKDHYLTRDKSQAEEVTKRIQGLEAPKPYPREDVSKYSFVFGFSVE